MENDFEYIKRIMKNYKQKNRNKKLTYTLSYNSQRFSRLIEPLIIIFTRIIEFSG